MHSTGKGTVEINIVFVISAPCEDVKCGLHAFCKPEGQEAYCICEDGWTFNPSDVSAGCIGMSYMTNNYNNLQKIEDESGLIKVPPPGG